MYRCYSASPGPYIFSEKKPLRNQTLTYLSSYKLLLLLTYRISSNLYIGQVVYTKWRVQNAYSGTGRRLKELAPRVRRACGYLYSASCREGYL
jgi:hypothetical protein